MRPRQLKEDIRWILKKLDSEIPYRKAATELLFMTMCVESDCGKYLKQVNGQALGICQMEPKTYEDIWVDYLGRKPDLYRLMVSIAFGLNHPLTGIWCGENAKYLDENILFLMQCNIPFQIAMARIYYWRIPEALPYVLDINALAVYWKKYYNTELGKGTIDKAIKKYHFYSKGI